VDFGKRIWGGKEEARRAKVGGQKGRQRGGVLGERAASPLWRSAVSSPIGSAAEPLPPNGFPAFKHSG